MKKENMRKFAVRPHLESGLSYCSEVVFFSFAPWQKKKEFASHNRDKSTQATKDKGIALYQRRKDILMKQERERAALSDNTAAPIW